MCTKLPTQVSIDEKSHQWFGATLASSGEDGVVVVGFCLSCCSFCCCCCSCYCCFCWSFVVIVIVIVVIVVARSGRRSLLWWDGMMILVIVAVVMMAMMQTDLKTWFESFVRALWAAAATDRDINLSSEIFPLSIPLNRPFPKQRRENLDHRDSTETWNMNWRYVYWVLWKFVVCFGIMSLSRYEICPCCHCRRQCKFFASSVNFSKTTRFKM